MTVEHQGHKQQVILTRGLPGSGKTTWCREVMMRSGTCWRYISRDDLRFMLLGSNRESKKWSYKRERQVTKARDTLLRSYLSEGCCVLMDETFLSPKTLKHVKDIIAEWEIPIEMKEFTADAEECIERDRYRGDRAVGAAVIREAAKMLRAPAPEWKKGRYSAILCDLDGTLALFTGDPYDRDYQNDTLNNAVSVILHWAGDHGTKVIFTSGRKEQYRDVTVEWLSKHGIVYTALLMRPAHKPDLKDFLLKRGWYEDYIQDNYNVLFVMDDRDRLVDMWRQLGLTCLQVDSGGF